MIYLLLIIIILFNLGINNHVSAGCLWQRLHHCPDSLTMT